MEDYMIETKIAFFTGDTNDPSSRFRVRQYEKMLIDNNIIINDYKSNIGKYPPKTKIIRPIWMFFTLIERLMQTVHVRIHKYDITFLQREMISSLSTFEKYLTHPIIFDVDDAIHLKVRTSKSIEKICSNADIIICGNKYLYDYYAKYNKKTYIIPTPIDTDKYIPKTEQQEFVVIGWMGTSSNFASLYKVQDAIRDILHKYPFVKFRVISNLKPCFNNNLKFEFIQWSPENEVSGIQDFSIGIMPLLDNEWSRGKCSFKMLQYMSCGKPVVVSPIGMNLEVIKSGEVGLAPIDYYEGWILALEELITNNKLRILMGNEGRRIVVENYSTRVCGEKLVKVINDIIAF